MAEPITDFGAARSQIDAANNVEAPPPPPAPEQGPQMPEPNLWERYTNWRQGATEILSPQAKNRLVAGPLVSAVTASPGVLGGATFNKDDDLYGALEAGAKTIAGSDEDFRTLFDEGRDRYEGATDIILNPFYTPTEEVALEVGGALAGGPRILGEKIFKLFGGGKNLFSASGAGATTGALESGLFAAGEEGDLQQQVISGLLMGGAFGPLGLYLPAMAGALTGTNTAKKIMNRLSRKSAADDVRLTGQDLRKADKYIDAGDGVSAPQRARQAVSEMDVTDDTQTYLTELQRTVTDDIGKASQQIDDALDAISTPQGPWGGTLMTANRKADEVAKNFQNARQNYEAAFTPIKNQSLTTADEDAIERAINYSFKPRPDSTLTGLPKFAYDDARGWVDDMYDDAREAARLAGDQNYMNAQPTLENVKQMRDTVQNRLSVEGSAGMGEGYAYMTRFKNKLDAAIDKMVAAHGGDKNFGKYRKAYSDTYKVQEAYQLGRDMFKQTKYTAEDLATWIQNNPANASDVRQGIATEAARKLQKNAAKGLRNLVGTADSPNADNIAKLRIAIGNDNTDKLIEISKTVGPRKKALEDLNKQIQAHLDTPAGTIAQPNLDVSVAGAGLTNAPGLSAGQAGALSRITKGPVNPNLDVASSEEIARMLSLQGAPYKTSMGVHMLQDALPNDLALQGSILGGYSAGTSNQDVNAQDLVSGAQESVSSLLDFIDY